MRQLYKITAVALLLFIVNFSVSAQRISSTGLPNPADLISQNGSILGSEGPAPGTILYGSTPTGSSSKPVLVFIHGYNSNPETWYIDNDMYTKAYAAGYRTVFVSVHPDKSMWTNGTLFKNMLQTITSTYGVSKVVVIAHSKGGVDTDAASIHYGAYTMIDRVITLSSPHHGTPLADLAHSSWTWWISGIIGQKNDATYVLQRGYMDYYRSVTDGNGNASNVDFRTIGAWGYSGWLRVSGWYINANGGSSSTGGNDGVVPYYSSKRPNSVNLMGGYGDYRTDVNHAEVKTGANMWQYVQPQILGASSNSAEISRDKNPDATMKSTSQIISADKGTRSFKIEEGAKSVKIDLRTSNGRAKSGLRLLQPNGTEISLQDKIKAIKSDGLLSKTMEYVELAQPQVGTYQLHSDNAYVAIITTENGVALTLENDLNEDKLVYAAGENMTFDLSITSNGQANILNADVTGLLSLTSTLKGNAPKEAQTIPVKFKRIGSTKYQLVIDGTLPEGIYNMSLHAENTAFRKSLISSFAVTEGEVRSKKENNDGLGFELDAYPNPFRGVSTIRVSLAENFGYRLNIYNMLGQVIKSYDLSDYGSGEHKIRFDANEMNLNNGVYIYELSDGKSRVTKSMVLLK